MHAVCYHIYESLVFFALVNKSIRGNQDPKSANLRSTKDVYQQKEFNAPQDRGRKV